MAELAYIKLDDEAIGQSLNETPGWAIRDGRLARAFEFDSYLDGVRFVGQVGEIAEGLDHHPDVLLTWRRVQISVETHSVGGISPFDFELAKRIDCLVEYGESAVPAIYRTFAEVDAYLNERVIEDDEILSSAIQASEDAGLPAIQVSPTQGKLLNLLALALGAERILEIGTLGGYSSIWLGRALPSDGRLITLEIDPDRAEIARANYSRAGLPEKIQVRVGAAATTLEKMVETGEAPFDFVFIDADKASLPAYYRLVLKLVRPGSLIVVDNVIRAGQILDAETSDPDVQGVQSFLQGLDHDERVSATAVQTVGAKGYDGFAVLRVNG